MIRLSIIFFSVLKSFFSTETLMFIVKQIVSQIHTVLKVFGKQDIILIMEKENIAMSLLSYWKVRSTSQSEFK